jgi:hypothetical protein
MPHGHLIDRANRPQTLLFDLQSTRMRHATIRFVDNTGLSVTKKGAARAALNRAAVEG